MKLRGKAWKYGDNVDTDVIIPARYLNVSTPQELARHCMEDIDPTFVGAVQPGDVIVAGENFGCGSSREHAPLAIKGAGVSCVVARSFARIFFRNAVNVGLPILECPAAVDGTETGHQLEIDLEASQVRNATTGQVYQAEPYPPFMMELFYAGGLVPYTRRRIQAGNLIIQNSEFGIANSELTRNSQFATRNSQIRPDTDKTEYRIAVLPGDGIGAEVIAEAEKVLRALGERFGHQFVTEPGLIGGAAIDRTGDPLPGATLALCKASDAVLFGAVGDPKYDDPRAKVRPEQGLLALRKGLAVFANLRPVKLYKQLLHASTIKPEVIADVDLLVVRELTGGIYFGERGRKNVDSVQAAYDTMFYTVPEIERVVRLAFDLARKRRKKVTSVDKANVLESSRLWRETAERVAKDYPDVEFESMYVDIAAMRLVRYPSVFDVMVTGNMFGDILTDEASMIAGSMGMLPSGAIGEHKPGLFEPIHGSAPKYTGQNVVNPIAAILSAAMLLCYSLELEEEAQAIEDAVEAVLAEGYRTRDIREEGTTLIGTREMGTLVAERIGNKVPSPAH